MTDSYNQTGINVGTSLDVASYDFRQVQALVPAGTTATIQGVKIPGTVRLTRLAWVSIVAPGPAETVALRLYRIRPATNPAGFGFIQLNSTFTITAANFPGAGVEFDFSANILANRCVLPHEYLACSWVHVGAAVMQPLNMNWNFEQVGVNEPEPAASTLVWPPA